MQQREVDFTGKEIRFFQALYSIQAGFKQSSLLFNTRFAKEAGLLIDSVRFCGLEFGICCIWKETPRNLHLEVDRRLSLWLIGFYLVQIIGGNILDSFEELIQKKRLVFFFVKFFSIFSLLEFQSINWESGLLVIFCKLPSLPLIILGDIRPKQLAFTWPLGVCFWSMRFSSATSKFLT